MNDLVIKTKAIESFSDLSDQQEGEPEGLGKSSFPELSECFPSSEKHYKFITHENGNRLAVPFRRVTLTGRYCYVICILFSSEKDNNG
jgi:hypothetical protein